MAEEIKKGKNEDASYLKNIDKYPGVDINKADKDKVNPKLVKQWTKEINNNPRNNDL
jgi:hypothetical protein